MDSNQEPTGSEIDELQERRERREYFAGDVTIVRDAIITPIGRLA